MKLSPVARSCGLLNPANSFHFKLNAELYADLLPSSLSHFECDGHTVHMLTQWCLLPPLTSTVKSSLFTRVYYSSLSWAARLHQCHANTSLYINNGWTSSRQTSCTHTHTHTHIHTYVCIYIHINYTYIDYIYYLTGLFLCKDLINKK